MVIPYQKSKVNSGLVHEFEVILDLWRTWRKILRRAKLPKKAFLVVEVGRSEGWVPTPRERVNKQLPTSNTVIKLLLLLPLPTMDFLRLPQVLPCNVPVVHGTKSPLPNYKIQ